MRRFNRLSRCWFSNLRDLDRFALLFDRWLQFLRSRRFSRFSTRDRGRCRFLDRRKRNRRLRNRSFDLLLRTRRFTRFRDCRALRIGRRFARRPPGDASHFDLRNRDHITRIPDTPGRSHNFFLIIPLWLSLLGRGAETDGTAEHHHENYDEKTAGTMA
jgi:hypothetical protein